MADTITHKLIAEEAHVRGWRTDYYGDEEKFLRITTNTGQTNVFRGSRPNNSPANSVDVTRDKQETLQFVASLGYDRPESVEVTESKMIVDFLDLHKEIVVKPLDSDKTQGVTVGITTAEQVDGALRYALSYSSAGKAIAQVQLSGNLYRILVIDGLVVAVTERRAAAVIGDGVRTVRELVEEMNRDPKRGEGGRYALQTIQLAAVEKYIGKDKIESIIGKDEELRVSNIESISAGGTAVNVTDRIHASWVTMAEHVVGELDLFIAGFDVMTEDIARPMEGNYVPLLEINSRPGLKIHEYPSIGDPIHAAPLLLDAVFGVS